MTPKRIITSVFVLSLVALAANTWQVAPALAGFTPTPTNTPINTPTPTNTPIPTPTHTPPPPTTPPAPPPPKQPKDTPVSTATIDLTATPATLPQGGEPADESGIRIILTAGMILLTLMSLAVGKLAQTNK